MKDNKRYRFCHLHQELTPISQFKKIDDDFCKICIGDLRRVQNSIQTMVYNSLHKNGESRVWNILPYTKNQLKIHIENLFEPWMNWDNCGKYIKSKWDDNNSKTWVWQMDHIIPRSYFLFTRHSDVEFQNCWSLNNIRPISAKQNILKGNTILWQ